MTEQQLEDNENVLVEIKKLEIEPPKDKPIDLQILPGVSYKIAEAFNKVGLNTAEEILSLTFEEIVDRVGQPTLVDISKADLVKTAVTLYKPPHVDRKIAQVQLHEQIKADKSR